MLNLSWLWFWVFYSPQIFVILKTLWNTCASGERHALSTGFNKGSFTCVCRVLADSSGKLRRDGAEAETQVVAGT